MDAYDLIVKNDSTFTTRIPFEYKISQSNGIFSENGYRELLKALTVMSNSDFISIYVCEPYTLTVCNFDGKMYILDTHPIGKKIGGVGTAAVVVCENTQPNRLCDWLKLRLKTSHVPETAGQMLILLTENKYVNDLTFLFRVFDISKKS